MRAIRDDKTAPLLLAILAIALVALVLPSCLAGSCGMTMTDPGATLFDLLSCDSMYLPQDVPAAVAVAVFVLFIAVVASFFEASARRVPVVTRFGQLDTTLSAHDPPGDSLFGKLRL